MSSNIENMNEIGNAHYVDYYTNWKPICGADKNKILFDKYKVRTTENFKYVTCEECIKAKEKRDKLKF